MRNNSQVGGAVGEGHRRCGANRRNGISRVSTRAAGTADLWILDIRTHKAKPLTSGPGGDFRPALSLDGKWIAFSSDRGSTLPQGKGRWENLHLVDIYLFDPTALA